MKRSLALVLTGLVAAVAVFAASHWVAQKLGARLLTNTDDLDWLRQEFRLSDAEMARIGKLHTGYLPKCAEMCQQIAAKKQELDSVFAGATNVTPAVEKRLTELGGLRAQCQAQMLRHFAEVSQAMPPEQGRRYLAKMRQLTLVSHEQIEQSMSESTGHTHGSH